jgi:hypothetical protein
VTRKPITSAAAVNPSINPDDFAKFLQGLVMRDISIQSLQAEVLEKEGSQGKLDLEYAERFSLEHAAKREAEIAATYAVRLVRANEVAPVAQLSVTYLVRYSTAEKMTEACFDQLRRVTLRIHTVPFAREWFRDTSGRMGLEPILLPLAIAHPAAIPSGAPERTQRNTK